LSEELINEMLEKINLITNTLDVTIQKVSKMGEDIDKITMSFSKEIVSLTENIRLIVEVLRQFRVSSNDRLSVLAKDMNEEIKKIWDKKCIEHITEEHRQNIDVIKQVSSSVSDTLYYTQLLSIVQSIRELMGRALKAKKSTI
jgi:methyl-accepting chemotaxis protein